jgi:4-hydroxy-2-oxoheptanedioate aldolase
MFLGTEPAAVNAQVACLVMIETVQAVKRAEEICATPGVDGVYIGPADLAVSMGLSPSFLVDSQDHADAIEHVRTVCRRAGIGAGIHTSGGEQAARRLDQGFDMVTVGTDAALLRAAAAAGLATARGEAPAASSGGYT